MILINNNNNNRKAIKLKTKFSSLSLQCFRLGCCKIVHLSFVIANKYVHIRKDKGILERWKIQLTKLKTETVIRNILSQVCKSLSLHFPIQVWIGDYFLLQLVTIIRIRKQNSIFDIKILHKNFLFYQSRKNENDNFISFTQMP